MAAGQDAPFGMSLAYKRLVVPFLSLMPNNPSEPCALELASFRGTFVDDGPLLSCGLHETFVDRAIVQCELNSPPWHTWCSYGRLMLVVAEPLCRPYVLIKTGTEFVLGLEFR
jgi:hypothetical protein